MNNYLENEMNKLIKYINNNNLGFGWKNYPYRNHNGIYISGEPFDYCIFMRKTGYKCCFDCKETIHNRWSIRKKDIVQAINLHKVYEAGVDSFFIILFKKEMDLRFIRITDFLKIKALRNYVEPNDCKLWKLMETI